MKTKPTQASVKELQEWESSRILLYAVLNIHLMKQSSDKIALFCNVPNSPCYSELRCGDSL
ncbi:MAG: hypothetical protein ACLR7D_05360 [Lachnospira eligens]